MCKSLTTKQSITLIESYNKKGGSKKGLHSNTLLKVEVSSITKL